MSKPIINRAKQTVTGNIRTPDGLVIKVTAQLFNADKLTDDVMIEAALYTIQRQLRNAQWTDEDETTSA